MFFLKFIKALWPFITKIVYGKRPSIIALIENKGRLLFVCLVFGSLGVNFLTVSKLITVSNKYIVLEGKYKAIRTLKCGDKVTDETLDLTNDLRVLAKKESGDCIRYKLPELPTRPPLPIDEIESVKNDAKKLSMIEKNHILALHNYIDSLNAILVTNYNDYITRCKSGK